MTDALRDIKIEDYNYNLPPHKIAQFPLPERDASKLLIYQNNSIKEDVFKNIASYLPADSLLVFNETRVVHARLLCKNATGARIEIFTLEPVSPTTDIQSAFTCKGQCTWRCLVGNARKWKNGNLELIAEGIKLSASLVERNEKDFIVGFNWQPTHLSFAHILETFGKVPLPPYINRDANNEDNTRYQTIFAHNEGSVAAPTAGLHFTEEVFAALKSKNIATDAVTLHVGAGTFKPVTSETIGNHEMHNEQIVITKHLIENILKYTSKHITLVGTTSVRALESVYWQGVKWLDKMPEHPYLHITQWDPYEISANKTISTEESLHRVLEVMGNAGIEELHGQTSLLIAPGYTYHIPHAIITNFHQPCSTLLLLVSAFIGENWKNAYDYALQHDFRFLSFGDSCLFLR